eukprot:scaffold317757_cov14-Tisochrysis_lutea.AAC.1
MPAAPDSLLDSWGLCCSCATMQPLPAVHTCFLLHVSSTKGTTGCCFFGYMLELERCAEGWHGPCTRVAYMLCLHASSTNPSKLEEP